MKNVRKSLILFILLSTQLAFAGPLRDKLMERRQQKLEQSQDISTNELDEGVSKSSFVLPHNTQINQNVAYGSDARQKLDIYSSQGAKNAPIIFMVHGGGWRNGDKTHSNVTENKVKYFVPKGYIFISINNRLLPDATPLQQAEDVAKALQFVQTNAASFGGDSSKIILMGHSAGAHLVSLLTSKSYLGVKTWRGTVSLDSAAYDVNLLMSNRHMKLFDDAFGADPQTWTNSSPLHTLQKPSIPILLVCSSKRKVSCEQSTAYSNKFSQLGGQASVYSVAMTHAEINKNLGEDATYTANIERFIQSVLK
jgi:arylformamidase